MKLEYLMLRLEDTDGTLVHVDRLITGEVNVEGVLRPLSQRQRRLAEEFFIRVETEAKKGEKA